MPGSAHQLNFASHPGSCLPKGCKSWDWVRRGGGRRGIRAAPRRHQRVLSISVTRRNVGGVTRARPPCAHQTSVTAFRREPDLLLSCKKKKRCLFVHLFTSGGHHPSPPPPTRSETYLRMRLRDSNRQLSTDISINWREREKRRRF